MTRTVRMIGGASSGGRTLHPGEIVQGKERDLLPLVQCGTAEWYSAAPPPGFTTVKEARAAVATITDIDKLRALRTAEETEGGGRVGVVDVLTRRIDTLTAAIGEG